MARKLKVYRTSMGFFELAVAAPSMKAAAEAWGSDPDIFRRGFAEQTEEPKVVDAAMAAPGVVLRRPVGSDGAFSEKAALPKPPKLPKETPPKEKPAEQKRADQPDAAAAKRKSEADAAAKLRKQEAADRAKHEKAAAREEEERRQALERQEREAERARKRREEMIAKADAALEKAKAQHEKAMQAIAGRRADLDTEEARDNAKWDEAQRDHGDALKEAKG